MIAKNKQNSLFFFNHMGSDKNWCALPLSYGFQNSRLCISLHRLNMYCYFRSCVHFSCMRIEYAYFTFGCVHTHTVTQWIRVNYTHSWDAHTYPIQRMNALHPITLFLFRYSFVFAFVILFAYKMFDTDSPTMFFGCCCERWPYG